MDYFDDNAKLLVVDVSEMMSMILPTMMMMMMMMMMKMVMTMMMTMMIQSVPTLRG
jgi:hypothetical protein